MEPMSNSEVRTWAMLCHLSVFAGYVFPFGNFIAPLIVWQIKKDVAPLIDDQGKESLNFQISVFLYFIVSLVLCFVIIGIPLLLALIVMDIVFPIIAGLKANNGEYYRYPMTIRFIN